MPTYCHLRLEIVLLESGPIIFSELFTILFECKAADDRCHGNAANQSRNRTGLLENNFARDLIKFQPLAVPPRITNPWLMPLANSIQQFRI